MGQHQPARQHEHQPEPARRRGGRPRSLLVFTLFSFADKVELDKEINVLRSELKVKVNDLREKEGQEEVKGLGLKALNKEEMAAVRQVIGPKPTWR